MYSWDFDSLRKMKNELISLKKLRRKELNKKDLLRIDYSIDTYNFLLSFFDEFENEPDLEKDLDDKTFRARYFYHIHREINSKIVNSCVEAGRVFENIQYSDNMQNFSYLDISSFDVINMTKEIFSKFNDKSIMDMVNDILDPNKHLLHVIEDGISSDMDAVYSGFSSRDSYNNIGYIVLFKNGKIRDLYTLVHEIFHIIIKQQIIPGYFTDDKVFLSEVEGAFSDLIVTDYLREKGIYLRDIRNIELLNYDTIRHFIRNLNVSHNYSNIMDGNNFSISRINENLEEDGYRYAVFDSNDIRLNLLSFTRDLNYSFSYLVALDLFYDYKNGSCDSIRKLRRVAKLNNNVLSAFNSLGITFIKDGYKNLKDYQKIITREKE